MEASLKKEGITSEFLKSVSMDKEYSPVQLMPNEEPVKLIRCSTGYWVMLEFGEYLKDEKMRLVVIPEQDAKIGRARYLLNFKSQVEAQKGEIYEAKIQSEIVRLKGKVDVKVKDELSKFRQILVMGGKIEVSSIEAALVDAIEKQAYSDGYGLNYNSKTAYEQNKAHAKSLATDELLATYDSLTKNKSFWIVMFVAALLIAKEILINKL